MLPMRLSPLLALALIAGCAGGARNIVGGSAAPADWRTIATNADRDRLRRWRDAWQGALAQVRAAGQAGAVTAGGPLLDPDRALPGAMPPPGDYRCRMFKLGASGTAMASFTAYPAAACRIARVGEASSLTMLAGAQRPIGLLFRDNDARATFLGTLLIGDETTPLRYGQDAARDMAGVVERVGERRWRLALPYPAFESVLDVVELVPAGRD